MLLLTEAPAHETLHFPIMLYKHTIYMYMHLHTYGFVLFWCVELLQKAEGGTSPNHTPESYPRIIPPNHTPNHTPESYPLKRML